jgi:hypothetical protein
VDDLIVFLLAQLSLDEAAAREAAVRGAKWSSAKLDPEELGDAWWLFPPFEIHARRHDPARVLREVAAGRAIIERYKRAAAAPPPNANFTAGQDDGYRQACADAIRDLAAVWSDHPDYREEWRP